MTDDSVLEDLYMFSETRESRHNLLSMRTPEKKALVEKPPSPIHAILPCHILPFAKSQGFFMRHEPIQRCRDVLLGPSQDSYSKCFALHGMGGVGRTSITVQFAYEVKQPG
jgi:hypothetical protein